MARTSKASAPPHPIQPVVLDEHKTLRFKKNAIVVYLLENGGIDLNKLASLEFDQNDREQFAQLIGYSLSGFSELSYVRDATYATAAAMAAGGVTPDEAKIAVLENTLAAVRNHLRELVPAVFRVHPDDLEE